MNSRDAMIVWTPVCGAWVDYETAGEVAVTAMPEPIELMVHPMSVGACDQNWREADDTGRRQLMQRYFTQMVHRDSIPANVVRRALAEIDDFFGHHFSAVKPDPDDESWL